MSEVYDIETRPSEPFEGQAPGTSGLRKSVPTFLQPNYTENFVQSVLSVSRTLVTEPDSFVLVSGGDGRYFVKECLSRIIIPMCAANGVTELIIGQNGLLSTPAVSTMIRKRNAHGGIILTASHNPGGPKADFGIKYNISNGGPAPEAVTSACFEWTKKIKEYYTIKQPMNVDLEQLGSTEFKLNNGKSFKVTITSSVSDYLQYMSEIFDFPMIKRFLNGDGVKVPFKVVADGLHGVSGPYLKHLLLEEFGLTDSSTRNCIPLEDFGGHHPDPNLVYAADLVKLATLDNSICLAAAFDGDADRNMIIGKNGFFVTPCDSLAVIADHTDCIKYFKEKGVHGFARSMPTSPAVDRVCKSKNLPIYEVPTGWKFFGNLMDANMCSICGEESFGTGSNHIREKDGIWTLLAWLSLLASRQEAGKSFEVESVIREHWAKYGRDYFTRYDYENCTSAEGNRVMQILEGLVNDDKFVGREFKTNSGMKFKVLSIDNFSYIDPVDKSVSVKQGYRIIFDDETRMVFRLSGTGSSGATLRMYVNSFCADESMHCVNPGTFLAPHLELAINLCNVEFITGRIKPTVIT